MEQTDIANRARPARLPRIVDWALRILLGAAFIAAGGAKLAGAPPMVQLFDMIGIGQWFRFVTGAFELAGGVLILAPLTAVAGASLLGWIMICALATHIFVIGGNPGPAAVLLLLSAVSLYVRLKLLTRG